MIDQVTKHIAFGLAIITLLTGCATSAGKLSQPDDGLHEWAVVAKNRVLFIQKQPIFERKKESTSNGVTGYVWSRPLISAASGMNELLFVMVTSELQADGELAVYFLTKEIINSKRKRCAERFLENVIIVQKSEFIILVTTCDISKDNQQAYSSLALIFRDETNTYSVERLLPAPAMNPLSMNDPQWNYLAKQLIPVRTCRKKQNLKETMNGSCDWFALNMSDVIRHIDSSKAVRERSPAQQ